MSNMMPTVGNFAAMREALLKVKKLFDGTLMFQSDIRKAHEAVNAALSAPARNCDVGTAEEQAEWFMKLCTANSKDGVRGLCSETCPFSRDYQSECALAWAQMPYEEGGAK